MIVNDVNDEKIKKNEFSKNVKVFNYGLAILKSVLAFYVVVTHGFKSNSTKNKVILYITSINLRHVPAFFIMSFYFISNKLLLLKIKIVYVRMQRLLIPYIFWPVIIWIMNNLINIIKKNRFPSSVKNLKLQLLWGAEFVPQFWYQWNLIAISILFFIVIFIFRKHYLFVFYLLIISAYIIQYSNYSYNNYYMKFPYYKRYTISRFFGMLPFAITGFILGEYKIIKLIEKFVLETLFWCVLIYKIFSNLRIFIGLCNYCYYGIELNIQALCVIFIFSLFPSDKIKNNLVKKIITILTNYSAGIYYLHITIIHYLRSVLLDIKKGTFLGIVINYLICYCICFFGMRIFRNTLFKYLFS